MKRIEIRPGFYRDSVSLMQVSQRAGVGVNGALVAMATPLNIELAEQMGFTLPATSANDLIIAIDAPTEESLLRAFALVEEVLEEQLRKSREHSSGSEVAAARTLGRTHGANVALISVPGEFAFIDAVDALENNMNVMIFSDNVTTEDEIHLKELAKSRDLLVMGPDCGTAIIGGVGLGFANVVTPGNVGIIAASGTGAQHLTTLLDHAGVGISHCIGLGGRDLSTIVAGRSAKQALELLAADINTEIIVFVSKPAAPEVAQSLYEIANRMAKPVIFGLLGSTGSDITETAEKVLDELGVTTRPWRDESQTSPTVQGSLRGLFAGGTLCDEAMIIASRRANMPIYSNIPLKKEWYLDPFGATDSHAFIDFGDDAMTVGRAHPMIDSKLRIERLAKEIADPACGVILLDVVLGHGATATPGEELAATISTSTKPIYISLIGTTLDPQNFDRQRSILTEAGASVFMSNAYATHAALDALGVSR